MTFQLVSITLLYLAICAAAQTSIITSVVSIFATTTVQGPPAPPSGSERSDWNHACNNFIGACVVYGGGSDGAAEYTTTIYVGSSLPSPTTVVTFSTTTIPATTTVTGSSAGACEGFTGACVVYGTGDGAGTTTVYASGSSNSGNNDGNGVIGQSTEGSGEIGNTENSGQLGNASSLRRWTTASAVGLLAIGFAIMIGV